MFLEKRHPPLDKIISRGYTQHKQMLDGVRVKKARQTVTVMVTVTREQQTRLRALAQANGLNMSELTRYALLRLFREPYIFLSPPDTNNKRQGYEGSPGAGEGPSGQ